MYCLHQSHWFHLVVVALVFQFVALVLVDFVYHVHEYDDFGDSHPCRSNSLLLRGSGFAPDRTVVNGWILFKRDYQVVRDLSLL